MNGGDKDKNGNRFSQRAQGLILQRMQNNKNKPARWTNGEPKRETVKNKRRMTKPSKQQLEKRKDSNDKSRFASTLTLPSPIKGEGNDF
ncbi:MAG: hypothetical protein LBV16_00270 [Elusimicrobiota bacterium]|nr:hypothetical protein [Elusimicrobiota bacterium]